MFCAFAGMLQSRQNFQTDAALSLSQQDVLHTEGSMIEVIYASVLGLIIPALLLQVSRRVYSHASGRKR
jgi:hypothetical protein